MKARIIGASRRRALAQRRSRSVHRRAQCKYDSKGPKTGAGKGSPGVVDFHRENSRCGLDRGRRKACDSRVASAGVGQPLPTGFGLCSERRDGAGRPNGSEGSAREMGWYSRARSDGVPTVGQLYVKEGTLAATVIKPVTAGPAVEWIVRRIRSEKPPRQLVLQPTSYPAIKDLARRV